MSDYLLSGDLSKTREYQFAQNVTPLGDRVLVRRAVEQEFIGKILVPDSAKGKPQEGVVLAVGKGRISKKTGKRVVPDVKAGDRVLFQKYAGLAQNPWASEDLLLMREEEILAVIEL